MNQMSVDSSVRCLSASGFSEKVCLLSVCPEFCYARLSSVCLMSGSFQNYGTPKNSFKPFKTRSRYIFERPFNDLPNSGPDCIDKYCIDLFKAQIIFDKNWYAWSFSIQESDSVLLKSGLWLR